MSFFPNSHHFNISNAVFNSVQEYNYTTVSHDVKKKLKKKLKPILDAYYSSEKICLEGTRVQVIQKINNWILAKENNVPQLFMLHGPAGTGKSAISHTMGYRMKELNYLGAFFCFDRTRSERSSKEAIKSIAYDLGLHIPEFGQTLVEVLDERPHLLYGSLEEHWESLIVQPAQEIQSLQAITIVIDALDECGANQEDKSGAKLLSMLLKRVHALPNCFRFLITSRPEGDILELLRRFPDKVHVQSMGDLIGTNEDIEIYVHERMKKFVEKKYFKVENCKILAAKAQGYFQWAHTVCEALHRKQRPGVKLRKQFEHFMSLAPSDIGSTEEPLDKLYKSILQEIFNSEDKEAMEGYREMMSQVLAAYAPLSQKSLAKIQSAYFQSMEIDDEEIGEDGVIESLGALLVGIDDKNSPIQLVHTSIRDFLLDKKRSKEYYIDLKQGHSIMAIGSMKLMTKELHFNMCNLEDSYLLNSEVRDLEDRISSCLPLGLQYACCFWSTHLLDTEPKENMFSMVEHFLCEFCLFWMEVLSILQETQIIPQSIDNLMEWMKFSKVWTQ